MIDRKLAEEKFQETNVQRHTNLDVNVHNLTPQKQAEEFLSLCSRRDVSLEAALKGNRLLTETLARIRRSLNLEEILQTTVVEVRQFLQADRVFITLNDGETQSKILAESVDAQYPSVLCWKPKDEALLTELKTLLRNNRVRVVEDITQIPASPNLKALYQQFQTRATLAVAIMLGEELFGALIANQCRGPHHWTTLEIDLLQQMSEQLAIAIQQAQLYQKLEQLNTNLERQVEERTAQLQQKMQEIQELNQVKDVVLHTVTHELRTTVMGNLMVLNNLLNSQGKDTTQLPHLDSQSYVSVPCSIIKRMIQGNERQLGMIDSLLEIHPTQKSILTCQTTIVSFYTLIQQTVKDLEPTFRQYQVSVKNLVPHHLPLVRVESAQIHKVIVNLVTYSCQQNLPGIQFTLKVSVESGRIRCLIQNDGIGMSKQECDRLFELHIRAPQERSSTSAGLKMFLCRQIIKAHGGEIGVRSNRKHGTTFWFTLPTADAQV